MIDTRPYLEIAVPLLVSGLSALPEATQRLVDTAIADGARVELRLGICDGLSTTSLYLCNLDGQQVELGRLG